MNTLIILRRITDVLLAVLASGRITADIVRRLKEIETEQDATRATLKTLGLEQTRQGVILHKILTLIEVPPFTVSIERLIVFNGATLEGVDQLQIKDNEQFDITLANPKDAKGQPSTIDPSKTVFQIDNPFAVLTPAADGLTCNVKGAAVGSAQISGSVIDANNPADVVLFTPLHLDVIAGDTVTIDVTTGPVTPQ